MKIYVVTSLLLFVGGYAGAATVSVDPNGAKVRKHKPSIGPLSFK